MSDIPNQKEALLDLLERVERLESTGKKDCCPHGVEAVLIYPCTPCTAKLNNRPPPAPEGIQPTRIAANVRKLEPGEAVEAKIKELCGFMGEGSELGKIIYAYWSPKLRELVKLARGTK